MGDWMKVAKSYLGVHEGTDTAPNHVVLDLFKTAGHPEVTNDHRTPWCAAFVGGVLIKSGLKSTGTLWALDYAKWGQPLDRPFYGCIAVKRRVGGGHVGFVVGANRANVFLLAGNQGDAVSIASFPRSEFVFRWPAETPIPAEPATLPNTIAGARSNVSEV